MPHHELQARDIPVPTGACFICVVSTLHCDIYTHLINCSYKLGIITRIGVFACGQILCISPNGLQASRGIN